MGYQLIEEITVGAGGAASIEFTSIPQDGVDLLLVGSLRGLTTAGAQLILINGSSANILDIRMQGSGSSVSSLATTEIAFTQTNSARTANTFGNTSLYVSNYSSNTAKSILVDGVEENNDTTAFQRISANAYTATTPITSITIGNGSNSMAEHSTASLYKITAD